MIKPHMKRVAKALASGAFLLLATGCTQQELLEFTQTVLLGITAAGAIAIIQNI